MMAAHDLGAFATKDRAVKAREHLEGATRDAPCALCERAPRRRKALCWTCHRKLREAGIKIPDRAFRSATPRLALAVRIMCSLDVGERAKVISMVAR